MTNENLLGIERAARKEQSTWPNDQPLSPHDGVLFNKGGHSLTEYGNTISIFVCSVIALRAICETRVSSFAYICKQVLKQIFVTMAHDLLQQAVMHTVPRSKHAQLLAKNTMPLPVTLEEQFGYDQPMAQLQIDNVRSFLTFFKNWLSYSNLHFRMNLAMTMTTK
jgi:hypothetical protein